MPHNPRKSRVDPASRRLLSDAEIQEAMARAVALRRRTAVNPETVRAQPLHAYDILSATESRQDPSVWARMQREGKTPEWLWIGWVHLEMGDWVFADDGSGLISKPYSGTWQVHLNSGDGRIWLRLERFPAANDDPYP